MRSKRVRRQISDDPNRWLISYADFITLLFAFFVVMYAVSSVDFSKYKLVAKSVGYAFDSKSISEKLKINASASSQVKNNLPTKDKLFANNTDVRFTDLNDSFKELDTNFYDVRKLDGWYEIEIKSSALFDSGAATLSPKSIKELTKLAMKLKNIERPIMVEGYTDITPISNANFSSNWALSSARAAIVAQIMDESLEGNSPLSAVGYASQYPAASNKTLEGREKNRRAIIVIAKDQYSQRLLNPIKSTSVLGLKPKIEEKNSISVKSMKIKETASGGLIFTQSIEKKEVKKNKRLEKKDKKDKEI